MNDSDARMLTERAKELECMYAADEVLQNKELTLPAAMSALVETIPIGFSSPVACRIRIILWDDTYAAADFERAKLLHTTPILVGDERVGEITMGYIAVLLNEEYALLDYEIKLLDTISHRISQLMLASQREFSLLLDILQRVDPDMLLRIAEKLRMHLKNTVGEDVSGGFLEENGKVHTYGESNSPMAKPAPIDTILFGKRLVSRASAFLPQDDVFSLIGNWIREERILALVKMIDGKNTSMGDILEAVRKFSDASLGLPLPGLHTETWLLAELAHRFLTNDERLINLVLDNLTIVDFESMIERIIGSETSTGNIGGKGAGLFIAKQILTRAAEHDPLLADIKTPRTWYIATDQIVDFLHYNNMEDLNSYKYNSTFYLRMTYDNLVSKIKNAKLPTQTLQMLRIVLDDLDGTPIIVRSSSLLEDRHSGAFSGKYKSLFLPNTGTKLERLEALADAVLEVYSSMYNPDSIEYRRERGLINFTEQMGVLIQEVVGSRIGKYYMPAFAGVAFSHNLLRWSPRIKREDGLVRMVLGLGTLAVDRVSDDYPVLFSPGQPNLHVNQTPDDIRRYSPRHIDLINLEDGTFETVDLLPFLRENGHELNGLHRYVSVCSDDHIQNKNAFSLNLKTDDMAVTFDTVLTATDMPKKIKRMLDVLSEKLDSPVDIEFASDGENIYLLQCRPQSSGHNSGPAPIPKNLRRQDILFTANRFISDGLLQDITHIVYVDGDGYNSLSTREELLAVGVVVGLLNDKLPRRKYILMGPGRWGSRGDIKLGVRVTYSDINGTAALIEIAREKHSYVPELSFGTHFFQDLVESGILYIPLYPDDKEVIFRESFFLRSENILGEILPEYAYLSDVVHVIDIPRSCLGRTLSLHLNSDLEKAAAFLRAAPHSVKPSDPAGMADISGWQISDKQEHWRWRHYMAEQIAESLDMDKHGVLGIYLIGSVNTGAAGMGSDIDLLLHVSEKIRHENLKSWLDGWSRALARINYLHTGYHCETLLDVHFVTDNDIRGNESFALKIGSATDPATPLRLNYTSE